MPYTKDEFNPDLQTKYKKAVARAAGTVPGNVFIEVEAASRRAGSVEVTTSIMSKDEATVDAMIKRMGVGDALKDKLNAELRAEGLKEATKITNLLKVSELSGSASRSPAAWAVTAAASAFALASMM